MNLPQFTGSNFLSCRHIRPVVRSLPGACGAGMMDDINIITGKSS